MTTKIKEEISRTLWHLHSNVITQVDAEAIIFPILDAIHAEGVAEGAERLQEYTAKYLQEGIKRCNAALAQGRREGAEQMKKDILAAKVSEQDYFNFLYMAFFPTKDAAGNIIPVDPHPYIIVPASVLAPDTKEGEP